jgi:hypothetical protein
VLGHHHRTTDSLRRHTMAVQNTDELAEHLGHEVALAQYADGSIVIECEECFEVLLEPFI